MLMLRGTITLSRKVFVLSKSTPEQLQQLGNPGKQSEARSNHYPSCFSRPQSLVRLCLRPPYPRPTRQVTDERQESLQSCCGLLFQHGSDHPQNLRSSPVVRTSTLKQTSLAACCQPAYGGFQGARWSGACAGPPPLSASSPSAPEAVRSRGAAGGRRVRHARTPPPCSKPAEVPVLIWS